METVPHKVNTYLIDNFYLIELAIILIVAAAISWIVSSIFSKLHPRLEQSKRTWDASLLKALYTPLLILIWAFTVTLIIPIIFSTLGLTHVNDYPLITFRELVFVVILFWFVMRYIANLEMHLLSKPLPTKTLFQDKTNVRGVAQITRIVAILLTAIALMQTVGIRVTTLLAFGGAGALVVSFAAKDTLSNFFGGMMIYWDRPFSVGDWIRSPDRNIEGTIENIGWRLTRLRTFDQRPLYVPNAIFSQIAIENPQRMFNRRIKKVIGLRYADAAKVKVILVDVEQMLRNHPELDTSRHLMVNLFEFGTSSLNFFIYTFTKTTDWEKFQAVQQDVLLKIIDIVSQHDAEFAFPTTTMHVPEHIMISQHKNNEV